MTFVSSKWRVAYSDVVTSDHVSTGADRLGTFGRLWIFATVAYGILRVALAAAFVADYGLNIAVFAAVEIGSSLVFGIASARLTAVIAGKRSGRRGVLAVCVIAGYFAPDAYVLAFAGRMPGRVLIPVVVIVTGGVVAGIVRFRRFRSGVTSTS